jgi:hypothetical protein
MPFLVIVLLALTASASHAQTVLETNAAFDTALTGRDRARLEGLLDPEFTWVFPDGSFYSRLDTLLAMPASATGKTGQPSRVAERAYGRVRVLEVSSALMMGLRVWVQRPEGWRLIHINELETAPPRDNAPASAAPVRRDTAAVPACDNPCTSVPYVPSTPRSRDALLSWQQQELGSHLMDMTLWGSYVTDGWVSQRGGNPAQSKQARIRGTLRRVEQGTTRNAQAAVLQMRLVDLEDAVLMVSLTQGDNEPPEYRSRIFVHDGTRADGGPRYKMAESYGQTVAGSPSFERTR